MIEDGQTPRRRATDSLAPAKILVVDDSRAIRTILRRILTDAGYLVVEAAHGREGLEQSRAEHPDLVLLDIDMPVMDGLATIKAMKADAELANIPVLFLTARTGGADVAEGLLLGARDYLRKPCEPVELVARVAVVLRLRAQEQELAVQSSRFDDLSSTDPLTGMGNRRRFDAAVDSMRARNDPSVTVGALMVDIDHFKAVNDDYGHNVGDRVLIVVSRRLVRIAGEAVTMVRWGGEEFLGLQVGSNARDLLALGESLRACVADSQMAVGTMQPLSVTISVGCARGALCDVRQPVVD